MSFYTQEAVTAEINYRLERAEANRRHTSEVVRPPWWQRVRARSGTRRRVARTTPVMP